MTKENKFKIGLCLQEIALSMDDATLEKNRERLKLIEDIIAGEQEQTGHWIEKEDFIGDTYYDCSECGESFCLIDGTPTDNLYNYCPNCGKKNGK